MPRVRRKSYNQISEQGIRIQNGLSQQMAAAGGNNVGLIQSTPRLNDLAARYSRVGNARNRYVENIMQRQGGYIANPNQRYTRNQYSGQSRGSIGG